MKMTETRGRARPLGVKHYSRQNKPTLMRSIQTAKGDQQCFAGIDDCDRRPTVAAFPIARRAAIRGPTPHPDGNSLAMPKPVCLTEYPFPAHGVTGAAKEVSNVTREMGT